eukprot:6782332-Karenia_brevis.AAC.1
MTHCAGSTKWPLTNKPKIISPQRFCRFGPQMADKTCPRNWLKRCCGRKTTSEPYKAHGLTNDATSVAFTCIDT